MTTSATGGFLQPIAASPPLQGKALLDFLQETIAGTCGLASNLVCPQYQTEPPNIPDAAQVWCSFTIIGRVADTFPSITHDGNAEVTPDPEVKGADKMQRQEQLNILTRFYDLGVAGLADQYATNLRDGLMIPQNLEAWQAQGFTLAFTGDFQPAPLLVKERWQYRVDLPFSVRRQIDRTYPVLNLVSAEGTITRDNPTLTVDWEVNPVNP